MKSVDILAVVDSLDELLLGDVARQGELHYEAVDLGVFVELLYLLEQALLGDIVLKADEGGGEAAYLAGFHFVGYIGLAASVVAHEDGGKVGTPAPFGQHLLYFGCDLLLDLGCYLLSVDKLHKMYGIYVM